MDTLFDWTESDSVKIGVLDDQHKKLFDIVNELFAAMNTMRGRDILEEILQRLEHYAATHFEMEESLMAQHAFPELASHRSAHHAMREKVRSFKKQLDAGSSNNVAPELLVYLQHWLRNHIRVVDQRYSAFLNARGLH